MNIHEYQGKELLRSYGIATPRGLPCFSPDQAAQAAADLGGRAWLVKTQVHAGGRGKGCGTRRAWSIAEVRRHAAELLGTTAEGRVAKRLLIEEGTDIAQAFYLGVAVDRRAQRAALMASSEGGTDIEELAARTPEKIHKLIIDPDSGLRACEAEDMARRIGIRGKSMPQARAVMQGLYRAFDECDASLAEINPLVLTGDGRMLALDAGFDFDTNALFRHPEIAAMRDPAEEELACVPLEGDIGCLANGAGLAMATMDAIRLYGGSPADFADVGCGASAEKVAQAFKRMLRNAKLQAILVNIFGGIMSCDAIAHGVVAAAREVGLSVPLVVRMKGSNEALGKTILAQSGLPIMSADDMAEAARMVVRASGRRTMACPS